MIAEVQVAEAHDPSIGPRRTEPRFGRFWRLLNPGSYTVQIGADGYDPVTMKVSVHAGGWRITNLSDGFFRLDGGSMWGVVPANLWRKMTPPLEDNTILLALRPFLGDGDPTLDTDPLL